MLLQRRVVRTKLDSYVFITPGMGSIILVQSLLLFYNFVNLNLFS